MKLEHKPLNIILLKCFGSILVVYLLFIPVFYIYNRNSNIPDWYFILANIIKFISIILVGVYIRKKNKDIIIKYQLQSKIYSVIILSGLALWGGLYLCNIPQKIYGIFASTIGLYDTTLDNLFFVVFVEQLFFKYFIASFLICSAVIFIKPIQNHLK